MLSLEQIRREPEVVRTALARRGADAPLDRVVDLDAQWRTLVTERDSLRAQHNDLSKRFGQLRREEQPHERAASARLNRLRQEIQGVTKRIEVLEKESASVEGPASRPPPGAAQPAAAAGPRRPGRVR